jgi:pimeloyl-ACP methyl ester carboxylesterase
VALWFAAALPERVLGCVCVDGGAGSMKEHFPTWAEAEERLRPPRISGITADAVREWAKGGPLAEGGDPAAAAEILLGNFEAAGDGTVRSRLPMTQHMEIVRHLYELDSFELMARIECPVLFVAALAGPWPTEEKARSLQRAQDVLGSRAQSVWVDGGHDLPVQRPAEVAKAISGFAEQIAGGRSA